MNKVGILWLLPLNLGCGEKPNSETQKVLMQEVISLIPVSFNQYDTLKLDLGKSKLFWKGTKMRRAGKHEGEVRIRHGFLLAEETGWAGGKFEMDMNSISITDIPKSDPIPIKNLTEHLMHEDFFDVDNFPVSAFEITGINKLSAGNLEISGNLTIRGISKNITFLANSGENTISSQFRIDRFEWNIAYEGSWVDRTLVDRDIEFRIELVLADENPQR